MLLDGLEGWDEEFDMKDDDVGEDIGKGKNHNTNLFVMTLRVELLSTLSLFSRLIRVQMTAVTVSRWSVSH